MAEPKLPPGKYVYRHERKDMWILEHGGGGFDDECHSSLEGAVTSAWAAFPMTCEEWEVIQRDHRAIEALRKRVGDGRLRFSFTTMHSNGDGKEGLGTWSSIPGADISEIFLEVLGESND